MLLFPRILAVGRSRVSRLVRPWRPADVADVDQANRAVRGDMNAEVKVLDAVDTRGVVVLAVEREPVAGI